MVESVSVFVLLVADGFHYVLQLVVAGALLAVAVAETVLLVAELLVVALVAVAELMLVVVSELVVVVVLLENELYVLIYRHGHDEDN